MKAIPRRVANGLTRELAGWLEGPPPESAAVVAAWGPETWSTFRRVVTFHGLAPYLARAVPGSAIDASVPAATLDWLAWQDDLNARRNALLHEELAAILGAAARADIEVMPLKGAILTTLPGADPTRRPMADLDLLVRPADRWSIAALLEELGYVAEPHHSPHPTHDVFLDPGGGRVVSPHGEHPDNPRRVEVHVEVKRHLWSWAPDDDLTATLWRGARRAEILGRPATVPRLEDLLAHIAIHASSDLLMGRGRLVQFLDLAAVAPDVALLGGPAVFADLPHARLAYPSLRLAARALPKTLSADVVDLSSLERAVPVGLARWAATVPLDSRAGLTTGRREYAQSTVAARWARWRPDRWRLTVAYGDDVFPLALARHGGRIIGRARARG